MLSLRWKYIISTTCIILVIIGTFSWQNLRLQEKRIAYDDHERVTLITEIIKNGLITIMLEGRGREFQNFLESLIAEDIEEVRLFQSDGTIISSSIPSEIGKKIYKEDLERFKAQNMPEVFSHVRNGKVVYSMLAPIYNEVACRRCHGKEDTYRGILDVEVSMDNTLERLANLRYRMIIFSVLTLITLSVSLGFLTKYLINKPIYGIMNTMKKVEAGDLTARFITGRKDEIGKLSRGLNSMLSELDNARKEINRCHNEEVQRIEKMATIGELAAAIAHEIKNPLAGISGAIQVFAEDFSSNGPKREIIEDIIKEIERLDKAVRDLLTFARPPIPHPFLIDAHSMMERFMNVISKQAEKQNIDIRLTIGENIGDVYLDPEQFQQVFLNIAINSIHAMQKNGNLDIIVDKNENSTEFIFKDTGQGINEEDMKNLFKPFFTTKRSGTGLGLAICKNIVEQHGGIIEVESESGVGSVFTISVPVREPENGQS